MDVVARIKVCVQYISRLSCDDQLPLLYQAANKLCALTGELLDNRVGEDAIRLIREVADENT